MQDDWNSLHSHKPVHNLKNMKQYELKKERKKEKEQAQVTPAKAHCFLDKGQLSAEYLPWRNQMISFVENDSGGLKWKVAK